MYSSAYSTFRIHEVRLTIAESAFQEHLCTPRNWRVLYMSDRISFVSGQTFTQQYRSQKSRDNL